MASEYETKFGKSPHPVYDFIGYVNLANTNAAENSKYARCAEIVKSITGNGKKIFVLPYFIKEMKPPPQPTRPAKEDKEPETPEPLTFRLHYEYATPVLRSKYARSNQADIKLANSEGQEIKTIEFVLFGEIIDYIFSEALKDKDKPASHQAALFTAFCFSLYQDTKTVHKVMNMRDVPVSVDLLWDLLHDSVVTDSGSKDSTMLRYYTDLISKAYSTIRRECDKSVKYLSNGSLVAPRSSYRKIGEPEINASELYVPKVVFDDVLSRSRKRKDRNRSLNISELKEMMKYVAEKDKSRSKNSDTPLASDYCRIMYFTSHMPFEATKKKKTDFHFSSYGQYGIVKNFSYSPVEVEGMLESAIAQRKKGKKSHTDKAAHAGFYKTLLKVDVSTYGYPCILPGMMISVDKTILSAKENSKINNSLAKVYFVTRATTTMTPGEYTTNIEGYPLDIKQQLSSDTGDTSDKPPTLTQDEVLTLEPIMKSYMSYLQHGIVAQEFSDNLHHAFNYIGEWLGDIGKGTTIPMMDYLCSPANPKNATTGTTKVYLNPGTFSSNKPYKFNTPNPGKLWSYFEHKDDGLMIKRYFLANPSQEYDGPSDPVEISVRCCKRILEETSEKLAELRDLLPAKTYSFPTGNTTYENCGQHISDHFKIVSSNLKTPVSVDILRACLISLEIIQISLIVWRDEMKNLAATNESAQPFIGQIFSSKSYLSDSYNARLSNFIKELKPHVEYEQSMSAYRDFENVMKDLQVDATIFLRC